MSTGAAKELETALQAEVARYRGQNFADNTKRTYVSHGGGGGGSESMRDLGKRRRHGLGG